MGEVGERVNILKIAQLFTKCRGKNLKQIVTFLLSRRMLAISHPDDFRHIQ